MLLVGPRPEDPAFVNLDDPAWLEILSVHPGMTGLAQLTFYDEAGLLGADPEADYRDRILEVKKRTDLRYVRSRSVRGDSVILLRTISLLLGRRR
jgi:lipopolysaccharide/colanic/teichoic acid biosynthesis glycosyltransferase